MAEGGRRGGGGAVAERTGERRGAGAATMAPSDDDVLKNIEFETSEDVDVTPTFDAMGLREDLIRGIYAYGVCVLPCYTS